MLITCPECGGKVSDQAGKCPHCGYPIENLKNESTSPQQETYAIPKIAFPEPEKKTFFKSKLFYVLVAIVFIIIIINVRKYLDNRWNSYFDISSEFNSVTKRTEYYLYNKTNETLNDVVVYFEFDAIMGRSGHYKVPQKVGKIKPHEIATVIYDVDKGNKYIEEELKKSTPDWTDNWEITKITWK